MPTPKKSKVPNSSAAVSRMIAPASVVQPEPDSLRVTLLRQLDALEKERRALKATLESLEQQKAGARDGFMSGMVKAHEAFEAAKKELESNLSGASAVTAEQEKIAMGSLRVINAKIENVQNELCPLLPLHSHHSDHTGVVMTPIR